MKKEAFTALSSALEERKRLISDQINELKVLENLVNAYYHLDCRFDDELKDQFKRLKEQVQAKSTVAKEVPTRIKKDIDFMKNIPEFILSWPNAVPRNMFEHSKYSSYHLELSKNAPVWVFWFFNKRID